MAVYTESTNSDTIIKVLRHEREFVTIERATVQDKSLSWEARGLLVYLLSLPSDWDIRVSHLQTEGAAGRDALRRMLRELQKFGYASGVGRESQDRGKRGRFGQTEVRVYESPKLNAYHSEPPSPENPATANPSTDLPSPDNTSTYKRKNLQKKKLPEERTEQKAKSARPPGSQSGADAPATTPAEFSVLGYLQFLASQPAYDHIDPVVEESKINVWQRRPANSRRRITERFLQNWVNRIERPLPGRSTEHGSDGRPQAGGRGDQQQAGERRAGRIERIEQTYASRDYERLADESL